MPPKPSLRIFEQVKAASTLTYWQCGRATDDILEQEWPPRFAHVEFDLGGVGLQLRQLLATKAFAALSMDSEAASATSTSSRASQSMSDGPCSLNRYKPSASGSVSKMCDSNKRPACDVGDWNRLMQQPSVCNSRHGLPPDTKKPAVPGRVDGKMRSRGQRGSGPQPGSSRPWRRRVRTAPPEGELFRGEGFFVRRTLRMPSSVSKCSALRRMARQIAAGPEWRGRRWRVRPGQTPLIYVSPARSGSSFCCDQSGSLSAS